METKRGGVRPGSGRPKLPPGEKMTMRSMKATDAQWKKIKEFAKELKSNNGFAAHPSGWADFCRCSYASADIIAALRACARLGLGGRRGEADWHSLPNNPAPIRSNWLRRTLYLLGCNGLYFIL